MDVSEARAVWRQTRTELIEHPARVALERLGALDLVFEIHRLNDRELQVAVASHLKRDFSSQWALDRRPSMRRELIETTRRLANFAASGDAVIDQAKVVSQAYSGRTGAALSRELDNARKTPAIAFFRRLRNHLLHVGPQPITAVMDPALGVTRLVIDRDQALRIGRLHESPQARAFIESFDEHGVDLPRACGTYDEALRGFASRFRAAIEGEHADALRSYQELEARHRAAQAIAYPDDD